MMTTDDTQPDAGDSASPIQTESPPVVPADSAPLASMETPSSAAQAAFVPAAPKPWGFWATLGLFASYQALRIVIGFLLGHIFTLCFEASRPNPQVAFFVINGTAEISSLAMLLWFIRLRKYPLRDYLALHRFRLVHFLVAFGVMIAMIAAGYCLQYFMGVSSRGYGVRSESHLGIAGFLFWVILVGPAIEETLYRGFLFKGIAESKAGPWGAVVLTSVLWASLHYQYIWLVRAILLAPGLFLAIARWKSNSTILCFMLHAFYNALCAAMILWAMYQ